ncbi:Uncharacterised protein [Mycobacteroides abscessus subsp. bolletii]|uniref:Uncharacterized protein n=1 Tax=Mycobacteroides abscessus subsp. bolletii TaxID=319705 RepID=A0A9Q7WH92_9MYCO|nr:hypothetical protein [Mycobacteroides abscessus]SHQ26893.1 Uncharacterised protein [Mycobacteroides abscessus subsp. bolletii]SHR92980.1 Uncharacterised protein [Mycobacteroides abscessus subsp. bolletii]SHS50678.1 Uncharacterised protein [Mycobacteroides abscessus subsp. bolletii]SHT82133.1 Uncharacterised protein [Mycobacteroides abscessus subsp. bolletii]SHU13847.1 Uncharacterised protein [Mycobacteroides abscessus subsp. bolletii]
MNQPLLSSVYLVLAALGLRVAVALVFYVAGALFGQRWATYGNLDIAINRLFRVLPRWGQVLVALTVIVVLFALSTTDSASAKGIALGIMIYLITTAAVRLPAPSNATERITGFPLREIAGLPDQRREHREG